MKFGLLTFKEQKWQLDKLYDDEEQANKKIKKSYSKAKAQPKIVKVPDIKPGLKIFIKGVYYKTILKENKSLYYLDNIEKPSTTPDPFLKEGFIDYFFYETFDGVEEYDENYLGNVYEGSNDTEDDINTYINEGNSKDVKEEDA